MTMPRYVILRHDSPRGLHFDFMLERGDVLKTWELPSEPQPGCEMPARPLPDHRLAYLDYEGPVGGDRGRVTQWDRGDYELIAESPDCCQVFLEGEKLHGPMTLLSRNKDLQPET
jgi:hypothetical protein